MIRGLRRRHRGMWLVLALLLPALYLVALLARPRPAVMEALPAALAAPPGAAEAGP